MKARYLSLGPLLLWRHLPHPLVWPDIFGRQAPLQVEIGFGNGEFLVREAQQHPEWNYIGLEVEWASIQRGLRRIAQQRLDNVRLLQIDARLALTRLFAPLTLQRAYTLFPCPWPKERHTKHRLLNGAFLTLLNSRLVRHGQALIVTDHQPYVDWVLAQVPGTGFTAQWQVIPPRFGTKYERKWHTGGQQEFYELILHKVDHLPIPSPEDIILQTYRLARFEPGHFCPGNLLSGPTTVTAKEFLYDPQRQKGMLQVLVAEEGLVQDFWIEISWQTDLWAIRPARGCGIMPTVGVQRALDLVRDAAQQTAT